MMDNKDGLHVGIVMDGNRRYARSKGLPPKTGHYHGARVLEKLFKDLDKDSLGISELTFYAFSMENFSRSEEELDELYKVFRQNMKSLAKNIRIRRKARIRFLGRLDMFPQDLKNSMLDIMKENKEGYEVTVNFLMAYNGQDEIADAIARIVENGEKNITRETVKRNIYLNDTKEADIIIRTGMEDGARLSGFMLWDSSYAELYFLKEYWPQFSFKMLKDIINDFKNNRKRRFGK